MINLAFLSVVITLGTPLIVLNCSKLLCCVILGRSCNLIAMRCFILGDSVIVAWKLLPALLIYLQGVIGAKSLCCVETRF